MEKYFDLLISIDFLNWLDQSKDFLHLCLVNKNFYNIIHRENGKQIQAYKNTFPKCYICQETVSKHAKDLNNCNHCERLLSYCYKHNKNNTFIRQCSSDKNCNKSFCHECFEYAYNCHTCTNLYCTFCIKDRLTMCNSCGVDICDKGCEKDAIQIPCEQFYCSSNSYMSPICNNCVNAQKMQASTIHKCKFCKKNVCEQEDRKCSSCDASICRICLLYDADMNYCRNCFDKIRKNFTLY